jgi:hypothetical protein
MVLEDKRSTPYMQATLPASEPLRKAEMTHGLCLPQRIPDIANRAEWWVLLNSRACRVKEYARLLSREFLFLQSLAVNRHIRAFSKWIDNASQD